MIDSIIIVSITLAAAFSLLLCAVKLHNTEIPNIAQQAKKPLQRDF